MDSPPLFIVGAERSGTTMFRLMLSHHPQLAWEHEFEYIVDRVSPDGALPDTRQYHQWLSMHRIFQHSGFEIDPALDYPQLVESFLRQFQQRHDKPIVGATVHRHFDRLLHLWPDCRLIHLVRDPRDVAKSCIVMGWAGNAWTGVGHWIDAEQLWDRLRRDLPPPQRFEVTYERLISDPVEELKRVCAFIGVEYDPQMLSYAGQSTYDKPDPSLGQKWRKGLNPIEIRLIEARVGTLLTDRGYEPSGLPPLRLTPLGRLKLRIQDRWVRFLNGRKRYGWRLWLERAAARRLGLWRWQQDVQVRCNEIDRLYLK